MDGLEDDEDDQGSAVLTPRKQSVRSSNVEETHNIVAQTAFDAYFVQASKSSRTSSNIFSDLVQPLSPEEYLSAMNSFRRETKNPNQLHTLHKPYFPYFLRELEEGFNLLFYGLGSKRNILNQFATEVCSRRGHVVVVNAFQPNFTIKDMLSSIEKIPDMTSTPLPSATTDNHARRICDYFISSGRRPLYLIIHNVDAPALRTSKSRSCLSILCSCPFIRVVASIDHINTPLLWSSTEIFTRKRGVAVPNSEAALRRGYAWLWHDLTTLAPYDFELSSADRSSIAGVSSVTGGGGTRYQQEQNLHGSPMTETAAQHILASVTQKAKKLFAMMASMQLKAVEEAVDPSATGDLQQFAIAYETLFNAARDNFIATNDTALRSLLGEFRDHALVLSSATGGGEALWIPLRKERLLKILDSLDNESQ